MDDHGDMQSGVVAPMDAPRLDASIVAEKHHDGVVGETIRFETGEDLHLDKQLFNKHRHDVFLDCIKVSNQADSMFLPTL